MQAKYFGKMSSECQHTRHTAETIATPTPGWLENDQVAADVKYTEKKTSSLVKQKSFFLSMQINIYVEM